MPELSEDMYCSQQICIPPTFPYLLRQFAKAAIRTQPNDLLKWSTTYFRCLSLNIPPPVKPRLEYPIPKDFRGLTPGWLRALLNQFRGSQTVTFKVLWDRWIGACLQHDHLIQILCLGGFQDNQAIPWLRFVAMCASFLTDSLTATMTLICEVLTEEPEGGSAMIAAPIFYELYEYLARIDASKPQTLRNYYFLDSFLGLMKERVAADQGAVLEEEPPESVMEESTISFEKTDDDMATDIDVTSVISCPSVQSGDVQDSKEYLKIIKERAMELEGDDDLSKIEEEIVPDVNKEVDAEMRGEDDDNADERKAKSKLSLGLEVDEKFLREDLDRLKAYQQELMGESDDEVEKFKRALLAEVPLTESQMEAVAHYTGKIKEDDDETAADKEVTIVRERSTLSQQEKELDYEDVYVDAVPGIGGIVPDEMIRVACCYFERTAKEQHNTIMPRNIRHYECPPMEPIDESL